MNQKISTHNCYKRFSSGIFLSIVLLMGTNGITSNAEFTGPPVIHSVKVSPGMHVNPSQGQSVELSFSISEPGQVSALVVDRDGYVVRHLAVAKNVQKEKVVLQWNGKTEGDKKIVPNEGYSFKIDWESSGKKESYFPASKPEKQIWIKANYYDRQQGILSYKLPFAARVHIHATAGKRNSRTGEYEGPVLKTIINREPRSAGAVLENWNGLDESGIIFVPDLPDFGISIAAQPLPENSIITIGNRNDTYLASIETRTGKSEFPVFSNLEGHHGLSGYEDISPALKIKQFSATWSEQEGLWSASTGPLELECSLEGPSVASFAVQPARLKVFVDGKAVVDIPAKDPNFRVAVPIEKLADGIHIVAINWDSDYGPIASNSLRLKKQ